MAELLQVKALVAFTIVTAAGVVHGDPDNKDEAAQWPSVPADRIDDLVKAGKIDPKAKKGAAEKVKSSSDAATPARAAAKVAGRVKAGKPAKAGGAPKAPATPADPGQAPPPPAD
ncbi:hypothetical protein HRJ34_14875 [Rhizorhabdus wittichii]|uniref:Uncharacterized protein n=1 Tax=Rhizorhabdus wittichii TaxID=160791 RepID=A0A975CYG2_9SPHN|nr:hypothetical protein [Rhizorhabdus wittichii]QTH19657.1 hypothetical protein HRJ34_14875 [Rhizorhabdus wittichii]